MFAVRPVLPPKDNQPTHRITITRNIGFGPKDGSDWALLASRVGVGIEGPVQAQAAYSAHNYADQILATDLLTIVTIVTTRLEGNCQI